MEKSMPPQSGKKVEAEETLGKQVPMNNENDGVAQEAVVKEKIEAVMTHQIEDVKKKEETSSDIKKKKQPPAATKQPPLKPLFSPSFRGSRTLNVDNLHRQVEKAHLENFFKDAGHEVVSLTLLPPRMGMQMGFAIVVFATPKAAHQALKLMNGRPLLSQAVKISILPLFYGVDPGSILVKGFDRSYPIVAIKRSLRKHFGSCGEITRIYIPVSPDSGVPKDRAYLDFPNSTSLNKALQLNGSKLLDGRFLTVEKARPIQGRSFKVRHVYFRRRH